MVKRYRHCHFQKRCKITKKNNALTFVIFDFLDIKESKAKPIIVTIIIILLLGGLIGVGFWQKDAIIKFYKDLTSEKNKKEKIETKDKEYSSEYHMSGNSLEKFDLYFLKLN